MMHPLNWLHLKGKFSASSDHKQLSLVPKEDQVKIRKENVAASLRDFLTG